jgi:hypothetical protein
MKTKKIIFKFYPYLYNQTIDVVDLTNGEIIDKVKCTVQSFDDVLERTIDKYKEELVSADLYSFKSYQTLLEPLVTKYTNNIPINFL